MDGVEPDDEAYPPAPVPRHERAWRHPSEIGEARWRHNEPPLAIGRGLLVTTGAIGGLLALAVLWAMLPTGAGGGPQALTTEAIRSGRAAASSIRQSTSSAVSSLDEHATERRSAAAPTTAAAATTTSKSRADATRPDTDATPATDSPDTDAATASTETASSGGGSTGSATADATTAASTGASPTSAATTQATISVSAAAVAGASTAIVVSVGGQPVVLTTAGAVGTADDTVTLAFDDGTTTPAAVTMTINGLAVLLPDAASSASTFQVAGSPHDGDTVTLLARKQADVPLRVDADGSIHVSSWGGADVTEGTPVVDADGKLVALCSKSGSGPKLVAVDQRTLRNAVDTTIATTSSAKPAKAYLGVQLNADPSGSLTIAAVDPNGPAAAAGVVAGDTVVAVDGTALASSDDLFDALGGHHPDDDVAVTIRHGDGSEATLAVTLAAWPASA